MCSFAVQIVYGILGLAVLGLTITSLAMDAWTKVSDSANSGLFCTADQIQEGLQNGKQLFEICQIDFSKFTNLTESQKVILICIILAIVAEACCLAYNFFTACACCCKTILLPVLTFLSVITAILLGIVVGVYLKANPDLIKELEEFAGHVEQSGISQDLLGMGNSFIFVSCAFAGAVINTIVSFVAIFCAATLV